MDKTEHEPSFSLNDFRKWMDNQASEEETSKKPLVGMKVESKVTLKKLLSKIDPEDGEHRELAREFYRKGGTISEVDGQTLLIEVDCGSFMISRCYVKREY